METSVISPELALVDPELAKAAREQLLVVRTAPPVEAFVPVALPAPRRRSRSRWRRRIRAVHLVAAAAILGYAAAWMLVTRTRIADHGSTPPTLAPSTVPAAGKSLSNATTSPTTTLASVSQAPRGTPRPAAVRLIWQPVPGAAYYDVILWLGHTRVLDIWPMAASVNVPRTWRRAGVTRTLAAGRYRWFVYPGFGPRSAHRFGPLAASGTFVVGTP